MLDRKAQTTSSYIYERLGRFPGNLHHNLSTDLKVLLLLLHLAKVSPQSNSSTDYLANDPKVTAETWGTVLSILGILFVLALVSPKLKEKCQTAPSPSNDSEASNAEPSLSQSHAAPKENDETSSSVRVDIPNEGSDTDTEFDSHTSSDDSEAKVEAPSNESDTDDKSDTDDEQDSHKEETRPKP